MQHGANELSPLSGAGGRSRFFTTEIIYYLTLSYCSHPGLREAPCLDGCPAPLSLHIRHDLDFNDRSHQGKGAKPDRRTRIGAALGLRSIQVLVRCYTHFNRDLT